MYMLLSNCSGGNNLPYNGKYVYPPMQLLGLKKIPYMRNVYMLLSICWGGNKILYMGSVYATMQLLGQKQTTIYGLCVYAAM